ncbi:MAG: hypothetical protein ABH858_06475 [Candidatus Omnitrophota bacterium]
MISPFYLSLLAKKTLIISSIEINRPYLVIERDKQGRFSLPAVKSQDKKGTKTVLIKNIDIKKLSLKIRDHAVSFEKTFERIDFNLRFSLPAEINFRLTNLTGGKKDLSLEGIYSLDNKKLIATIEAENINLAVYNPYFTSLGGLNSCMLKTAHFTINGSESYDLNGKIILENIDFINAAVGFKGNMDITPSVTFSLKEKQPRYSLDALLSNCDITKIPYLEKINQLTGDIKLTNNSLTIKSLQAQVNNYPLKLSGRIDDFKDIAFDIEAGYESPLENIYTIAAGIKEMPLAVTPKGTAAVKTKVKGNIEKKDYTYTASFSLSDASIGEISDIKNFSCQGTLDNKNITLKDISFNYKDIPVKANLALKDMPAGTITADIESGLANAGIKGDYAKDTLTISSLTINKNLSQIKTDGKVTFNPSYLSLRGIGSIAAEDILNIIEQLKLADISEIKKFNPAGTVKIDFETRGSYKDNSIETTLSGSSEKFSVSQTDLTGVKFIIKSDKEKSILSPLLANLWDGKTELKLRLSHPANILVGNLLMENIDLSRIKEKPFVEKKNLAGRLSLEGAIESLNPRDIKSITGHGKLAINGGKIWEISFLRGLGELLFIPDFERIVFEEGYVEFLLKDKSLVIDQVELESVQMKLEGQGAISFDNTIDFMLFPTFNPSLLNASDGLKRIMTDFLGKTGLAIEIKGTVQKPRYRIKPVILSPIDTFRGILEQLLK